VKKETSRQKIAKERIIILFEQANKRPSFARRYVSLARKMSSRHKVPIPLKWRRFFCKECNEFWVPGRSCTVRKRKNRIVYKCLNCNSIRRFEVKK